MKTIKLHAAARKYLCDMLTMLIEPKDNNQAPLMVPAKVYLKFWKLMDWLSDVPDNPEVKTIEQVKDWIKDNQEDFKEFEVDDRLFDFFDKVILERIELPPFAAGAYMNILAEFSPEDTPSPEDEPPPPPQD